MMYLPVDHTVAGQPDRTTLHVTPDGRQFVLLNVDKDFDVEFSAPTIKELEKKLIHSKRKEFKPVHALLDCGSSIYEGNVTSYSDRTVYFKYKQNDGRMITERLKKDEFGLRNLYLATEKGVKAAKQYNTTMRSLEVQKENTIKQFASLKLPRFTPPKD